MSSQGGLKLTVFGTHVLRHSLAIHLLREGVAMKAIGDTLGHRDATSTAIYLRLALGDLRSVGLPIPENGCAVKLLKGGWEKCFPRVRTQQASREPEPIRFRSALGGSMKRYLALKRALGREYGVEERTLAAFDAFLHVRQWRARTASRGLFDAWRESLDALRPAVRRKRLCIVRNYLAWHARQHPGSFVPELESFPKSSPPQPPRLVSVQEMASLLATASRLVPSNWNPLRAESIRMGLLLLFCCGLRCGELLRLKVEHFDLDEELLRIEATKFHKSRLAPLDPSVTGELRRYLDRRRHGHIPTEAGDPLIWSGRLANEQAGYTPTGLTQAWKHLCLSVGVLDEQGRPPRLHDLRHSFAVHALHRWYLQGVEVRSRLPHLATYMGHVNIASTHYYLQLTPSLGEAASRLFHDRFAELFQEGEAQ